MQNNERIVQLLTRRLKGLPLTVEENQELDTWVARSESNQKISDNLSNEEWLKAARKRFYAPGKEAGLAQLRDQLFAELPAAQPFKLKKLLIAASVLFILATAVYLMIPTKQDARQYAANDLKDQFEITPGGEAILTLSNGLKIPLRDHADGLLAQLGEGKQLLKQDGKLVYQSALAQHAAGEVDTSTYPRSDQYSVLLPDGSRVWLNRNSKLNYPQDFAADSREVELEGEGYFEIAKVMAANGKDRKPFIVKVLSATSNQPAQVEVLGTHFNIQAYKGEAIRTTLAEGKVKMVKGEDAQIMKPGQQAVVKSDGQHIEIRDNIYVEGALAWTNNQFRFEKDSINTVLNELTRWYQKSYHIAGETNQTFSLISDRNKPLSELLRELNKGGKARFTMDGDIIVVTP